MQVTSLINKLIAHVKSFDKNGDRKVSGMELAELLTSSNLEKIDPTLRNSCRFPVILADLDALDNDMDAKIDLGKVAQLVNNPDVRKRLNDGLKFQLNNREIYVKKSEIFCTKSGQDTQQMVDNYFKFVLKLSKELEK
jgi:hypothetical protein